MASLEPDPCTGFENDIGWKGDAWDCGHLAKLQDIEIRESSELSPKDPASRFGFSLVAARVHVCLGTTNVAWRGRFVLVLSFANPAPNGSAKARSRAITNSNTLQREPQNPHNCFRDHGNGIILCTVEWDLWLRGVHLQSTAHPWTPIDTSRTPKLWSAQ